MADRTLAVPLTDYQREILALLAQTRSPDSYLAGGAALHFSPESTRYSHDLDFFHDSSERVAEAFAADSKLLEEAGHEVRVELSQPGFIRWRIRAWFLTGDVREAFSPARPRGPPAPCENEFHNSVTRLALRTHAPHLSA